MQESDSLRHPIELYRYIRECLRQNRRLVVATVIARSGSGPRETGASMVITEEGKTLGTVGGGILEARVIGIAKSAIGSRRSACRSFMLADSEATGDGMLCGGQMEILAAFVDSSRPEYTEIFDKLLRFAENGLSCRLIWSIRRAGDKETVETALCLLEESGEITGSLMSAGGDPPDWEKRFFAGEGALPETGDIRYFIRKVDAPETVFIFGAGHVGRELSEVCNIAGFRTVVIDDRREFANSERFPRADDIIVPGSFQSSFDGLTVNASSYIVIATRGHAFDQLVLSQALNTKAGYIGMIASRRKKALIFQALQTEGVPAGVLAVVRSPVGIDIGAKTPAEIAVSIAAELISVRAGRNKTKNGQIR